MAKWRSRRDLNPDGSGLQNSKCRLRVSFTSKRVTYLALELNRSWTEQWVLGISTLERGGLEARNRGFQHDQ
jgi:hypothetical protein